jgi:hypothetical protein
VSRTNWEGTGVKPDVAVAADDALKTAHVLALKSLEAKATDPTSIAEALQDLEKTGDSRVPASMPK